MRRREFITLIGGAAAAWPLEARAQQGGKLATVGVMASGTVADTSHLTAAFVQRLRELGWIEGRNVAIEYRWGEGRTERFTEIADRIIAQFAANNISCQWKLLEPAQDGATVTPK